MATIPDSASVFGHTIAVFFFYTLKPFSHLNVGSLLLVYGGTNIYCLKQKVNDLELILANSSVWFVGIH